MEATIKEWCDSNIAPNMSYRGSIQKNSPIACLSLPKDKRENILKQRPGKLMYQDGTACSGGYSFVDVYQLDSGEYQVYVDYGSSKQMGGEMTLDCESVVLKNLMEVVDYVADCSVGDPNSCKEMKTQLSIRSLVDCCDDQRIIQSIKDYECDWYIDTDDENEVNW